MFKPELLLPVGNTEAFHAAVKGGADAVFMGLKSFNARGKATNFTISNLQSVLDIAKRENVKVYITLNTVIKNSEINELLDVLYVLSQTTVSAIIIQDWGIYFLAKKFFPELVIHASTQMANHNSLGANYSEKLGFERVIMARELTLPEVQSICKRSKIEIELFSHGALCYSYSGMCLFSSYLGGQGANRGLCAQPCRRKYGCSGKSDYSFSLKDNQAIDFIPEYARLKIASIKIEGRMKSDEYVYRVAKAYRMAIDDHTTIQEAKELLKYDFGREKTSYFMGSDVSDAITQHSNTGVFIGTIIKARENSITFKSDHKVSVKNRIRIHSSEGSVRKSIKVKDVTTLNNIVTVKAAGSGINPGDKVFLSGFKEESFSNKLPEVSQNIKENLPFKRKRIITESLCKTNNKRKEEIFVRVDNIKWLRKIRFEDVSQIILNFSKREWKEFKADSPFLQKNSRKIIIELPKYISENEIDFYKGLCNKLSDQGYKHFMLSHISQKEILPKGAIFSTNENVYIYNDAAVEFLRSEKCRNYTYPLENEFENLKQGKDRQGIIPVYFYPELFFSRMPVKINSEENVFEDDKGFEFQKVVKNGMTIVVPTKPVALLQYRNELRKMGINKFLIDFSHINPSQNIAKTVLKRLSQSQQIQPSTTFNFKKGLK